MTISRLSCVEVKVSIATSQLTWLRCGLSIDGPYGGGARHSEGRRRRGGGRSWQGGGVERQGERRGGDEKPVGLGHNGVGRVCKLPLENALHLGKPQNTTSGFFPIHLSSFNVCEYFTLFTNSSMLIHPFPVVCTPAVKSAEPFSLSKKKSPFPFEPQGVCLQTPPFFEESFYV